MGKTYGATVALEGVSCRFEPGEVHAVLGENGAGKSTLVGILAGLTRPSSGSVILDGRRLPMGDPLRCRQAGVELVHQHFTLAPGLTVQENLELARMGTLRGMRSREVGQRAAQLAENLGWHRRRPTMHNIPNFVHRAGYPLWQRVEDLGVAKRQQVEILKALLGEARVLILDEPTASLAPSETGDLFAMLRRLADEGRTVILIAHKLMEVRAVADRATVLRGGRVVGTGAMTEISDAQLVQWMIGRKAPKASPPKMTKGETVLQLDSVSEAGQGIGLDGITFGLGQEIFGIGGVEGNGQRQLAEVLAGIAPYRGAVRWQSEVRALSSIRCGYIPEDRNRDGIAGGLSIERNLLVHVLDRVRSGNLIRPMTLRDVAMETIAKFGVKASGSEALASSLSGGNAQKVVVAGALESDPELVVAHNPTRGLDLGARETIHAALRKAAESVPVVLLTSDLDELFELAGRTAFLSNGRLREGSDPALMAGWDE